MKQSSLNDEKVQNSNSNIRGRLKKFSEDLKETNPDAFKNYEFNINRVDNFISRNNINDTNSDKNKAKISLPGLYDYGQTNFYINTSRDIDSSKSYPRPVLTHLSQKEPPPEFDKALGCQSRFGDGDGSFWDRWVSIGKHITSHVIVDKGLPVYKSGPPSGFKKCLGKLDKSANNFRLDVNTYKAKMIEKGKLVENTIQTLNRDLYVEKEIEEKLQMLSYINNSSDISELFCENPPDANSKLSSEFDTDDLNCKLYCSEQGRKDFSSFVDQILLKQDIRSISKMKYINSDFLKSKVFKCDFHKISVPSKNDDETDILWKLHLNTFDFKKECETPNNNKILDPLLISPPNKINSDSMDSPRTNFILNSIGNNILPQAKVLIRKNKSTMLSLRSEKLGDKVIAELSKVIDQLPYLKSLDISDNNLTCFGIQELIKKIMYCSSLEFLDISHNKFNDKSVSDLCLFLCSTNCKLSKLVCKKVFLDDCNFKKILKALSASGTIEVLDLSSNLIGMSNIISNKKLSGSESVTSYKELLTNVKKLNTLNLSWNAIDSHFILEFKDHLQVNNTLTHLDLSNNNVGKEGAEYIGDALYENKYLKYLNLSNNNITSCGVCALLTSTYSCTQLRTLELSYNPIGEGGLRSYLFSLIALGNTRLEVIMKNCNFLLKEPSCRFDWTRSHGDYEFNLSKPYERSVCIDILRYAAEAQSIKMFYFKYSDGSSGFRNIDLCIQSRSLVPEDTTNRLILHPDLLNNIDQLRDYIDTQIISETNGYYKKNEIYDFLKSIFICDSKSLDLYLSIMFKMYDLNKTGRIESNDLVEYLSNIVHSYNMETSLISSSNYMSEGENDTNVYLPPKVGKIQCHLKNIGSCSNNTKCITPAILRRLEEFSKSSFGTNCDFLEIALPSMRLGFHESLRMFQIIYKIQANKVEVLSKILPNVSDPFAARSLVTAVISNGSVTKDRFSLKSILRYLYLPILNLPNGHYKLNLNDDKDLFCLVRLRNIASNNFIEYSNDNCEDESSKRITNMFGENLSTQYPCCFRNTMYNGKGLSIAEDWLEELPPKGVLEFDFISFHPIIKQEIISNQNFISFLKVLNYVGNSSDETKLVEKLKELDLIVQTSPSISALLNEESWPNFKSLFDGLKCLKNCEHNCIVTSKDFANLQTVENDLTLFGSHLISINLRLTKSYSHDPKNEGKVYFKDLPRLIKYFGFESSDFEIPDILKKYDIAEGDPLSFEDFSAIIRGRLNYKSIVLSHMEAIEEIFASRILSCSQLYVLIEILGKQFLDNEKSLANFQISKLGNLRVEVIVKLFSKLKDPHRANIFLEILPIEDLVCLSHRLGLNFSNTQNIPA